MINKLIPLFICKSNHSRLKPLKNLLTACFIGLVFCLAPASLAAQASLAGQDAGTGSLFSDQSYPKQQVVFLPTALTSASLKLLLSLPDSKADWAVRGPIRSRDSEMQYLPGYIALLRDSTASSPHKKRVWAVAGSHIALWTGSYIALNRAWYAGYPRAPFHFFDDHAEWNQMDKAGHVWTTYQVSRASAEAWKWAGLDRRQAAIWGGISGMTYQAIIEIQDGFSREWGFSWSDFATNLVGAGAYVFQEQGWGEQRIQVKLSYWPYRYAEGLADRRNQLFGKSAVERILKDYNSQTYWISANMASFLPESRIPAWLNIALGYGAGGMLGGHSNIWNDKEGNIFDYSHIRRERFFYLSPDIDFTRIPSKSKLMRALFFTLNAIKMPAPALVLNNSGKLTLRAIHF